MTRSQKMGSNNSIRTYLSIQIFSTWGTNTCNKRIIVWKGIFNFQLWTHSDVGSQFDEFLSFNFCNLSLLSLTEWDELLLPLVRDCLHVIVPMEWKDCVSEVNELFCVSFVWFVLVSWWNKKRKMNRILLLLKGETYILNKN